MNPIAAALELRANILVPNCLIVVVAFAFVASRWRSVRGTTLIGPWVWLLVALAAIGMYEVLGGSGNSPSSGEFNYRSLDSRLGSTDLGHPTPIRLLLSTVTLCPAISLLGAKRPQDKPWHFIVASLWVVLTLPGIQAMVMSRNGELDVHAALGWFLIGLILFGITNSVFSRFWPCILLAGFGATVLLSPFLPGPFRALTAINSRWGTISYSAAALLAAVRLGRSPRTTKPMDRLWRDFRDAFGLVWTLRVAERINATAQSHGWNISADWQGIRRRDEASATESTPEQTRAFRQNLSNLLRRFVNDDWIAERLDT